MSLEKDLKHILTRRDTSGDSDLRSAASTDTNGSARTPGPWSLHPRVVEDPPRVYGNGVIVATVDTSAPDVGERESNAEFIVRACNSHAELLAAVKWAYEYFEDRGFSSHRYTLSAAIAKAESAR